MAWFSRDKTTTKEQQIDEQVKNLLLDEDVPISFAPLWEDEAPSGLAQFILPTIQVILLLYIAIVVHGLK